MNRNPPKKPVAVDTKPSHNPQHSNVVERDDIGAENDSDNPWGNQRHNRRGTIRGAAPFEGGFATAKDSIWQDKKDEPDKK